MIPSFTDWTPEHIQFIKDNYLKTSAEYCAKALNRTRSSIWHKAERLGLKKPHRLVDVSHFETIARADIAYILGYWWADGYVGTYRTSLGIAAEDMIEIESILTSVGQWDIRMRKTVSERHKPVKIYRSGDRRFVQFLTKHDYRDKSRVSPTKILAHIPECLRSYFWRGFFDGDGSLTLMPKHAFGVLSFAGSYTQDWSDLERLLKSFNIRYKLQRNVRKDGNNSRIIISYKEGVSGMCQYMYRGRAEDGIGLNRKYERYLSLLAKQADFLARGYSLDGRRRPRPDSS